MNLAPETAAYLREMVREICRDELRRLAREEVRRLRFPVAERDTLTKAEVGVLLDCGPTKLKTLMRAGLLVRVGHDGKRTLISRESVERYLASKGIRLVRSERAP